MHHGFAFRYLADVMQWPDTVEAEEISWLRIMSEFKYDSYHDFLSGSRFAEGLLNWLQQFEVADRQFAYDLLRNNLIFISLPEMQHLVRCAFPAHILPNLESRIAKKTGKPRYLLRSDEISKAALTETLKKTLFIALSDGARIDYFRRSTYGEVGNEQVLAFYDVSTDKWAALHENLKQRAKDPNAVFEAIVLIDDFTASGTTLIDFRDGAWKGKLTKLNRLLEPHGRLFACDMDVLIHHYIGTAKVAETLKSKFNEVRSNANFAFLFKGSAPLISFGMLIHDDYVLLPGVDSELDAFLHKYFDAEIMTKHLKLGGCDATHGFAGCGLPLVIEHNTPNNSLAILWAESQKGSTARYMMRPLFRRRQRHN